MKIDDRPLSQQLKEHRVLIVCAFLLIIEFHSRFQAHKLIQMMWMSMKAIWIIDNDVRSVLMFV